MLSRADQEILIGEQQDQGDSAGPPPTCEGVLEDSARLRRTNDHNAQCASSMAQKWRKASPPRCIFGEFMHLRSEFLQGYRRTTPLRATTRRDTSQLFAEERGGGWTPDDRWIALSFALTNLQRQDVVE